MTEWEETPTQYIFYKVNVSKTPASQDSCCHQEVDHYQTYISLLVKTSHNK
jgi:hypothetical protein